ncbi:MAG: T9SS type A sorting domain-containing protein [bacterium]
MKNHFKQLQITYLLVTILCGISKQSLCQSVTETFIISGNISTENNPVQNALITFFDEANPANSFNAVTDTVGNYSISIITSIDDTEPIIPTNIELAQNYPNPFSNTTTITYRTNEPEVVAIKIYDILGREIKTLVADELTIGTKGIVWDGRNNFGTTVTTGVYFYLMKAGNEILSKKMIFNNSINSITLPQTNNYQLVRTTYGKKYLSTVTGKYNVVVQSDTNTSPLIVIQEFPEIILTNDTTINFEVEKARLILCQSIDDVEIGDDSLTLIEKLGYPDYIGGADIDGYIFCYLDDNNYTFQLYITLFPTSKPLVFEVEVNRFYEGKTKEGVKIGMYRNEVIRLLGPPNGGSEPGPPTIYDYYSPTETIPGIHQSRFELRYDSETEILGIIKMLH